jgi:serine/threonine-protein kinase
VAAAVPADAAPAAATAAVGDAAPTATAAASAASRAKPVAVTANNAARARERRPARDAATAPAAIAAAAPTTGVVNLAVSPWGQVEVDGVVSGTTPPLSRLSLPAGAHRIVIRNEDFPPFAATVTVDEDKPVTLRHRFGT